jgi:5-hydroxyisourate hydrolase
VSLSTHVLDTALGVPAAGVEVRLLDGEGTEVAAATTDDDGRAVLLQGPVPAGTHRLVLGTAAYQAAHGVQPFFAEVAVAVVVREPTPRLHVPVLLSPFGCTTYRGS